MVVEMVPLKGGIGSIWGPPEGKDYKWYISGKKPANWGIICHRSHLLGEPETTIDWKLSAGGGYSSDKIYPQKPHVAT